MLMEKIQKPLFRQAEKYFTSQLMNKDENKEVFIMVLFLHKPKRTQDHPHSWALYSNVHTSERVKHPQQTGKLCWARQKSRTTTHYPSNGWRQACYGAEQMLKTPYLIVGAQEHLVFVWEESVDLHENRSTWWQGKTRFNSGCLEVFSPTPGPHPIEFWRSPSTMFPRLLWAPGEAEWGRAEDSPLLVSGTKTAFERHLWLLCLQTKESSKSGDAEGEQPRGFGAGFWGRGECWLGRLPSTSLLLWCCCSCSDSFLHRILFEPLRGSHWHQTGAC